MATTRTIANRIMPIPAERPKSPDDTAAWSEFLHELANLVDGSLRSVELARRGLEEGVNPEITQRQLNTAGAGLGLIAELVRTMNEQVQGLSALVARKVIDQPRPLHEVIGQAIDLVGPLASERSIAIHTEIEPEAGDLETRIFGSVLNGLRNAVDAINHNGEILVRARIESGALGREVIVEVCDDGAGPPNGTDASRVFDLGFSTKPGSTGIGLALARDLVEQIGGSVSLEPRWDDRPRRRGAVLCLRYPLDAAGRSHKGAA